MNEPLFVIHAEPDAIPPAIKQTAITSLETGKVIHFPDYTFQLQPEEQVLLSPAILDKKRKNISYDYAKKRLAGLLATDNSEDQLPAIAASFMHRYAEFAKQLIEQTLPQYTKALRWGRTSYRPAEIKGRVRSKRQDDTRVHVDAFPASPVNGLRILRVFCNINPNQGPRVWNTGESFEQVLCRFSPNIPTYSRMRAHLLHLIKATKTLRSPYDHFMLNLHDSMKLDDHYQQTVHKQRIDFQPHSTWIVYTDHVSHAALSGQYLLEQTFYLPVDNMENPELSPLRQINHLLNQKKAHQTG